MKVKKYYAEEDGNLDIQKRIEQYHCNARGYLKSKKRGNAQAVDPINHNLARLVPFVMAGLSPFAMQAQACPNSPVGAGTTTNCPLPNTVKVDLDGGGYDLIFQIVQGLRVAKAAGSNITFAHYIANGYPYLIGYTNGATINAGSVNFGSLAATNFTNCSFTADAYGFMDYEATGNGGWNGLVQETRVLGLVKDGRLGFVEVTYDDVANTYSIGEFGLADESVSSNPTIVAGDCSSLVCAADADADGVCDSDDVCPGGDDNLDADSDGVADFCDPDDDNDGCLDVDDATPFTPNAAPTIELADGIRLWPPDFSYITLSVEDMVVGVMDNCGSPNTSAEVRIQKVVSDEAEDAPGTQDGNTLNDILISADCRSVQLRKERMGGGNGRVYRVTLAITGAGGEISTADYLAGVPRWAWGWNSEAVEDAPLYTVEGNCNLGTNALTTTPGSANRPYSRQNENFNGGLQAYPNPFNKQTTIHFHLPEETLATLIVYDLFGREVVRLAKERLTQGEHQIVWESKNMPDGVYIIRLEANNVSITKKLKLQK